MRARRRRNALVTLPIAVIVFGALGCGSAAPPPQLPSTAARDRVATRVELVDLVISNPQRAAKVRALYIAMDALLLDTKRAQARQLALLGAEQPSNDEERRGRLSAVRQAESDALESYIELQLELRHYVTPDEFARLDKIR